MASFTIRNIPETVKHRVRQLAANNNHSMEEYLRQLILSATQEPQNEDVFPNRVRERAMTFDHQPNPTHEASRARIERLIALGKDLDFEPPKREHETLRDIDFS